MSISSISSLLNPASLYSLSSTNTNTDNTSIFQQQLAVSSSDPTTVASTDSSSSTTTTKVHGHGGHHHHSSSASSDNDSQSILNNVTQTYGSDAADEVTSADGTVDFSKLSQLMGSSGTQSSAANPLLNIIA